MNVGELNTKQKVKDSGIESTDSGMPSGSSLRRRLIKGGVSLLARILLRLKFEGVENIPPQGGLIIATNHMSRADTPILLLNPIRADLAALVTDKYKHSPIIGFLVSSMPHIWLDRSRADFSAFREAIKYLNQGGALGIAPEGTRSKVGALIEGKPGAVLLAVRAGVPIVPVGIAGSEVFQKNLLHLRPTPVRARYGKPFRLPPFDPEDRGGYMRRATEEIMCQIAAQLPEKYHGFYHGHPRLQAILENQDSST